MLKSVLLAAALGTAASSADAAGLCGPRSDLIDQLASQYEEHPTALGLSSSGRLLEILTRRDGGSWTVIATSPDGVSCVLDAGQEWLVRTAASSDPEA